MLLGHEMQKRWLCGYSVKRVLSTPRQVQRGGGYSRRWNNLFQAVVLCHKLFLSPEANYCTHPAKTSYHGCQPWTNHLVSVNRLFFSFIICVSSSSCSPHSVSIGSRISTFNFLVQLPSSAAGYFAKAPTQEKLEQTQYVCALWPAVLHASAIHSLQPGICDMLDLTFHLHWPQAAQWVPEVPLTWRGAYLCSFFLGFAKRRSKQPDIWLHLAAVPVYVMPFFPSLYFLY